MTMDKQSEQAVLTIGRTFRKDSLALYAGILVLAIFLMVNHAVATETDSPASEATMEEETSEGLSDDDFLMEEEETTEEGDDDDAVSIVEKMIEGVARRSGPQVRHKISEYRAGCIAGHTDNG